MQTDKMRNNEMVRAAVTMVALELKNNRDFRLSWQCSIAQSLHEITDRHPNGKNTTDLYHEGANNFISKLVGEQLEVIQ